MDTFLEVIKLHLKSYFQYKMATAITLLIQPFTVLINVALFSRIYQVNGTSSIKGYSLDQMVWYFTAVNFIWVFILTTLSLMKFILVVLFSFTLNYLFNFLIGLLAFVIKNITSLNTLKMLIISFAGGALCL